ncbi:MAG TPA: hypothetical protein VJB82_01005 [Candidatus Peribacterales bacterium]|nr:hypothetical protein [Candidatus Peribacterales bacterium]
MKRDANKRLWKDEEIIGMNETMLRLRRMRSAATMHSWSIGVLAKKFGLRLRGIIEPEHSQQESLSDAQKLADAAADFFAARISKTSAGKQEFQKWQDLLSDAQRQYRLYAITTYARSKLVDAVGQTVIGRLRNLHIDPDHMMNWDFTEGNNLGIESTDELLEKNIGIVSPLSGDYLSASTYQAYLRRTKGKTFPLTPAAMSGDLSHIVLLQGEDGSLPFADKDEIGFFLDATETGNTGRALASHMSHLYPEKIVHKPIDEKVEFTQSQKIVEYWK